MQTALLSLCCGFTGRQLRWSQVRTSERMDVLLKSTDDKVCKVTPRQGLSVVCTQPAATLLSTGSRRHGRPQGIRLGFPPFSLVSAAQGIYQHLNQMQLAFVTRSCKLGRKRWFVGELDFPGLNLCPNEAVYVERCDLCARWDLMCWSRTVQTILESVAVQIIHELTSNDKIKKNILINYGKSSWCHQCVYEPMQALWEVGKYFEYRGC